MICALLRRACKLHLHLPVKRLGFPRNNVWRFNARDTRLQGAELWLCSNSKVQAGPARFVHSSHIKVPWLHGTFIAARIHVVTVTDMSKSYMSLHFESHTRTLSEQSLRSLVSTRKDLSVIHLTSKVASKRQLYSFTWRETRYSRGQNPQFRKQHHGRI